MCYVEISFFFRSTLLHSTDIYTLELYVYYFFSLTLKYQLQRTFSLTKSAMNEKDKPLK